MPFSVLMSVYEKEKPEFLEKSLESIFDQTLKPNELVIIKDGLLTKELDDIINKYMIMHNEIRTFQFEENVKLGRALEKGVELCKYDIIARMDSDDLALNNRFEVEYDFLKSNPNVSVVGSQIQEFDEEKYLKIKKMPIMHDEIYEYTKKRNPVNHMTVMFRKKDVLDAGNYEHFPLLEDYYLWSRMLVKGYKFSNVSEVLVLARSGKDMYYRRGGYQYFKSHFKLRRKQFDMKLLNFSEFIYAVMLSFGFTMCPNVVRKVLYNKVLRK